MENIKIIYKEHYYFTLRELRELVNVMEQEQYDEVLLHLHGTDKPDESILCYTTAQFYKNNIVQNESMELDIAEELFTETELQQLRQEVILWNN